MNLTKLQRLIGACTLCCVVCASPVFSQKDSSALLLSPERLKEQDVLSFSKVKSEYQFVSANRTTEESFDVPYSTWVIQSDDILRMGFVTLADVLKAAPGIRVSQPGNAYEGETFVMRGLSGNQYVKILINDVPIKPGMALGMPIGAQLPIRQAERIEVMYGAGGGMMYGGEACAGVVNIILKETERPIFTQADLGFGSNGFNNLDLMFGGRLFKDRNVVKFSLFGSSTIRNFSKVYWEDEVFDQNSYGFKTLSAEDIISYGNFYLDTSQSVRSPLPHESRMFGMQLNWKGLKFNYYRMNRNDPSNLGFNPLAYSYNKVGTDLLERIDVYSVSAHKRGERYLIQSIFSSESYRVDKNSSSNILFNQVNALHYIGSGGPTADPTQKEQILFRGNIYYSFNTRNLYARGLDNRLDTRIRLKLGKRHWWTNGLLLNSNVGYPVVSHMFFPMSRDLFGDSNFNGISPIQEGGLVTKFNAHAYSNLELHANKWHLNLGGSLSSAVLFQPRIGLTYKVDSMIAIFGNYAASYKEFHPFQQRHTFGFDTTALGFPYLAAVGERLPAFGGNLPENFRSMELGIKKVNTELTFFHQNGSNLPQNGYLYNTNSYDWVSGYVSGSGKNFQITGVQLQLRTLSKEIPLNQKDNAKDKENTILLESDIYLQYSRGKEWLALGLGQLNEIRNYPHWMGQWRTSGRWGRLQAAFSVNGQSGVTSKFYPFYQLWERNTARRFYPGYITVDTYTRFYVNKNFVLYFNVLNVGNSKTYGLDASGSLEDLLAPVQLRRQARLGITYNMN